MKRVSRCGRPAARYNWSMESVIRNVKDIEADKRQWIEAAIGHRLKESQQVIIRVVDVGVEPDAETRRRALAEAAEIARRGRAGAAAGCVTEEEVDAALEEAVDHVRRHKV